MHAVPRAVLLPFLAGFTSLGLGTRLIGQCDAPPPPPPPPPPVTTPPPPPPPPFQPGDVVVTTTPPRGPGGAAPAPTTPGPGAPAGPAPAPTTPTAGPGPASAPATPGPGGPAGPTAFAGARTPTATALGADETTWETWWDLHMEPYLQVRNSDAAVQTGSDEFYLGAARQPVAVDRLQPTAVDVGGVLTALERTLAGCHDREVTTACMLALARTGGEGNGWHLVADALAPHLADADPQVRAIAALAIGVSGHDDPANLQLLAALALDRPAGRQACRRTEVDDRTRAFACQALGLIAGAGVDSATRYRAVTPLIALLEDKQLHRDVRVAAAVALGAIDPGDRGAAATNAVIERTVAALGDYFDRSLGRGDEAVQAHCLPAIGRLLGSESPQSATWRMRCVEELAATEAKRRSAPITQSCALALGDLCAPIDGEARRDFPVGQALLRTWREHPDAQTRYFAAMSLARIGGSWCRGALLEAFPRAGKAIEQPWLAMAIGALAFAERHGGVVDRDAGELLRSSLRGARNPSAAGAFAIGLGLCGCEAAAPELRELLQDSRDDGVRGHAAIALALLGHRAAGGDLRVVLEQSLRRPELLTAAAVALSVLGDRSTVEELMRKLEGETNLARVAAVAAAIGRIGDRRAIGRLVELLGDPGQTALARASAAAALGGVADRQALPWHTTLRGYVNYRAAVATLRDGTAGILDLR